MYKKAFEQLNKFYDIDLNRNTHADEVFDVLNQVIKFDKAGIFYLTATTINLEYGKNFEIYEDLKPNSDLISELFDKSKPIKLGEIQQLFKGKSHILCDRLIVKGVVVGILLISRKNEEFSADESIIFQTCTKIISDLITNLEMSKILKKQIKALGDGFLEINKAYETIKKQNKKIKQQEKLQNQFIANISHDFRTPLNSIIGFSEVLQNEIFGNLNSKQKEYITEIRIAGISLLGMINEILDISKLESKTMNLKISEINLNLLINEVCNILEPLAQKKNIRFETQTPEYLYIKADYIKLQQVFFNIIGNAIKFSPQNSPVQISVNTTKKGIEIAIKDFGIGIDKKFHKKIFDKFFQVQDNLSKTGASTGLGLAISKEFIRLHNGKILVDSEVSKGTTFTIILKK